MIFSSNKKIHQLHINSYFIVKNSFVVEVTFKLGMYFVEVRHQNSAIFKFKCSVIIKSLD